MHISDNHFSSTIPESMLTTRGLVEINVNNNKLLGVMPTSKIYASSIDVETNRLSGYLSVSVASNASVRVLKGNIYDCKSLLPAVDPIYSTYICGSEELNNTLVSFFVVFGSFLVIVIYSIFRKLPIFNRESLGDRNITDEFEAAPHVKMLITAQWNNLNTVIILVCFVFIIQIISYPSLKSSKSYSTLSFQYSWDVSAAYMAGAGPLAVLTMIVLFGHGMYCRKTVSDYKKTALHQVSTGYDDDALFESFEFKTRLAIGCLVILELFGFILIDVAYIVLVEYCKNQDELFWLQVGSVLFQLFWESFQVSDTVLYFDRKFKVPKFWGKVYIRSIIMIGSNIVAPSIAMIFASSSCFSSIITKPAAKSLPYTLQFCSLRNDINYLECENVISEVRALSFNAPLVYNNGCRNEILEYFVPIFILYVAINFMIPVFECLFYLSCQSPKITLPGILVNEIGSIYWPSEKLEPPFKFVYSPERIMVQENIHVILILTYGILSPPLLIILCIDMVLQFFINRYIILRYLKQCKHKEDLEHLNENCHNSWLCPMSFINCTMVFSCCFHVMFMLDMAFDSYSLKNVVWVLVIFPLIFGLLIYFNANQERITKSEMRETIVQYPPSMRRFSSMRNPLEASHVLAGPFDVGSLGGDRELTKLATGVLDERLSVNREDDREAPLDGGEAKYREENIISSDQPVNEGQEEV